MMKRFLFSLVALATTFTVFAQTQEEAFKDLLDGRIHKALKAYQQIVAQQPANVEANYWLGQVYLVHNSVKEAGDVYTKAMAATGQNPLIVVGVGHVELLQGKAAEAKAHFEAAIAATGNKKNKKYGEPAILNAIIRANADGDSKIGDIDYAIQKATQNEEIQGGTADMYRNLGLIYLKKGGEYGGQAKRAYERATEIDPTFAAGFYRIGRIFESQRNTELFLEHYEKAIAANSKFAPAYLQLYNYWSNRDVNKAKQYLDAYIANADQDKETDYFYADYLFRAGKYAESLQKGQEIEAALPIGEKFPKIYKLYAYNYDRMKDSISAIKFMEKYMNEEKPADISGDDYSMMATTYLKVPGNEVKAENAVEKALKMDTSVVNKVGYMESLANAFAAQQNWAGQFKWLDRKNTLKPDNSARNYYFLADAAFKAKEYVAAQKVASEYIKDYPDQPQGYFLKWKSAIAADPDTASGSAIAAVDEYTQFLMKDVTKYKDRIITNHGYKIYYYMVKAQDYQKALDAANAILSIDPANNYGQMALSEAQRLLKATSNKAAGNSPASKPASSGSGGPNAPAPVK